MTIGRVTHLLTFNVTLFGSEFYDLIGLLAFGLLCVVMWFGFKVRSIIEGLLLVAILVEIFALTQFFLYPLGVSVGLLEHFVELESQLFYSFGRMSMYLMVLILLFWAVRFPLKLLVEGRLGWFRAASLDRPPRRGGGVGLLPLSFLVSVAAGLYPYLPAINEKGFVVSVDVPHYVEFVSQMLEKPNGVYAAFTEIANGDRPLPLLLIFFLHSVTGIGLIEVVKFLSLLLGPLLVLATFYLVKSSYGDGWLASIAALLTSTSHYIVVGIYGGFFANWLAIFFMMLYLAFLVRGGANTKASSLIASSLILILILFTHPYTWTPLLLSTVLYLIAITNGGVVEKIRSLVKPFLLILAPNLGAELFKSYILGSVGGVIADYSLAVANISPVMFLARFAHLNFTFTTYVGGYLSNPLILLFSLPALLMPFRGQLLRAISYLIIVVSLPTFFGNYLIQSRLFYILPFPILVAFTLRRLEGFRTGGALTLLSVLVCLTYTFRSLFNLPV
jgi:hypothetical protein